MKGTNKMAKTVKGAKAPKYASASAVVSAVSSVQGKAKLDTARILAEAISGGITAAAIARAWDGEGAMKADAIIKYALAYAASVKGADFSATLAALNSNSISRDDVKAWTKESVPSEFAQNDEKGKRDRSPSDPAELTRKALQGIVKRAKEGKVGVSDTLAALQAAHADLAKFGLATGTVKAKVAVSAK